MNFLIVGLISIIMVRGDFFLLTNRDLVELRDIFAFCEFLRTLSRHINCYLIRAINTRSWHWLLRLFTVGKYRVNVGHLDLFFFIPLGLIPVSLVSVSTSISHDVIDLLAWVILLAACIESNLRHTDRIIVPIGFDLRLAAIVIITVALVERNGVISNKRRLMLFKLRHWTNRWQSHWVVFAWIVQ